MTGNDERLLARLTEALSAVPGVRALVLGGSRARGTATPDSDYDIGIWYDGGSPFAHEAMQQAAEALGDEGTDPGVTPIGGWGEWIDGGGWLTVAGRRVDLLYRDLRRIRRTIEECRTGLVQAVYQPGHPHAFVSSILVGEVASSLPLWDPSGEVAHLKRQTEPYSTALRDALVHRFLWEAGFALDNAEKSLPKRDVAYVAGCCFRSIACTAQVLFALNGRYLVNEKGAIAVAGTLPVRPGGLVGQVEGAYRAIGAGDLSAAVGQLRGLVRAVSDLVAGPQ